MPRYKLPYNFLTIDYSGFPITPYEQHRIVPAHYLQNDLDYIEEALNELSNETQSYFAHLNYHKNLSILDHPDKCVTTSKLADYCVTNEKLAVDSVMEHNIVDSSITTPKLADESITFEKFNYSLKHIFYLFSFIFGDFL